MLWTTHFYTWARSLLAAMLGALSARPAAALLTTPHVKLFKGATAVSPDSAYADFTAPTFSGYADQVLTIAGPINLPAGAVGMEGTVTFIATAGGPFVADVADGYVVTDGAGIYYGGERFTASKPFGLPGDSLVLTVILPAQTVVAGQGGL